MANRRILVCILATMIIIVAGCGKTNKTKSPTTESATNTVGVSVGTQKISSKNTPSAETIKTEQPTESAAPSETQVGNISTPTLNTQSPSASEQTATVKPTAEPTVKPTSKPTVTVKPTVKPTATPTKAPTDEELKAYYKQQAANTVEEINKRRNVQLIVLPGLTEYAEYRAKQLETNFAHDSADQKAASKALQYGKYTNNPPSQAVLDVLLQYNPNYVYEPSYFVPAAEAICKATGVSADFWNSPGHWSYVGSDEYLYIGVGASKGGTCVCVAAENTDLLK